MLDAMTDKRTLAPSTLTELRTRCATITRIVASDGWSLAKVHQLRHFARSLHEQIVALADAGMTVGSLLPLSERLVSAVDRRAQEEVQANMASFGDALERLATGDEPADADAAVTASLAIVQDVALPIAAIAAAVPVREQGTVSADALATVRDIGSRIRQARLASSMSQGQLAAASGVGRRFLSELEAGKPTLEIGRVLMVCSAAGVPLVLPAADATAA